MGAGNFKERSAAMRRRAHAGDHHADLTRLRVDNVMDLEEERPMNLTHGRHVFRVAGFKLVVE